MDHERDENASTGCAVTHEPCSVSEFIKADRQWPRRLRIAHAKYQLANASDTGDQKFWLAVVKVNSDQG